MKKNDNSARTIDEILELEAVPVVEPINETNIKSTSLAIIDNTNKAIAIAEDDVAPGQNEDDDAEFVRKNLKELLITGTKSLKKLSDFAETAESARTFEVVAGLIKTLADTSMQLMDVHKKKAETKRIKIGKSASVINRDDVTEQAPVTTTNTQQNFTVEQAVFVGTSADLLQQLKGEKTK